MYSSKLNILIYLIIILISYAIGCLTGYDHGLAKATKSTKTTSDILTINTKTLYMTVDSEKNFIIETEEVKKDDK